MFVVGAKVLIVSGNNIDVSRNAREWVIVGLLLDAHRQ